MKVGSFIRTLSSRMEKCFACLLEAIILEQLMCILLHLKHKVFLSSYIFWRFSEGPTSQHDTIELRGFDENEKITNKKKQTTAQKRKIKEQQRLAAAAAIIPKGTVLESPDNSTASSEKNDSGVLDLEQKTKNESTTVQFSMSSSELTGSVTSISPSHEKTSEENVQNVLKTEENFVSDHSSFNLEDILKSDDIPGLLTVNIYWFISFKEKILQCIFKCLLFRFEYSLLIH